MKKTLLFLGTVAMMASCTQEELIPSESAQDVVKGIVFESAGESATRGELEKGEDGQYRFFWYAEEDRINVYASNVVAAASNTTGAGVATDAAFASPYNPAVYKATKSGNYGLFTAKDDANWINFANNGKIVTIATYNAAVNKITAEKETVKVDNVDTEVTKNVSEIQVNATIAATQTAPLNYVAAPMLSKTEGSREKSYHSVGERMNLDFYRIFPVAAFSGAQGNDAFNADLGKLKSVTLVSTSTVKPTNDHNALAKAYFAGNAKYTVKYNDNGTVKSESTTDVAGGASEVKVNVGAAGETWTSDKRVYMALLPVDRTVTKGDGSDPKQATEKMTIKYEYENVTLEQNVSTSKDWIASHKIIPMPTLDIEKDFPYIVTEDIDNINGGVQRKLIVNKGNVKDAFFSDDRIDWQCGTGTTYSNGSNTYPAVEVKEITEVEIRANVNDLTADDYAKLNKLTNVTKMVVKNATTTITYNALSALANLAELQMDNVTTIQYTNEAAKNTPVNTNNLATVKLPKFNFADNKEITTAILNASVLTTLDMSGTPSMKDVHPYDGMSLAGYTKLATVTVHDGVVLGPESFKGCTALTTITGYVILGGYGAFEDCTSLTTISIDENETNKIFDKTFKNAINLTDVFKKDGKTAIVPAIIGNEAFYGTKANIDLTATTSIGNSAFKNNPALKGAVFGLTGSSKYQLVVNATTVGESAFDGATSLQYVKFNNLQTVNKYILANTTMEELKFVKVFTFAEGVKNKVFGTTTNTKLFVNPAQEYSGNTISANGNTITFKAIIEEN